MFNRLIIKELEKWGKQKDRKPLVIRGARQVGKTTLVNQFAGHFEQYIYLNLELPEDIAREEVDHPLFRVSKVRRPAAALDAIAQAVLVHHWEIFAKRYAGVSS